MQEFREKIRAADALLIVTPEYNYSIPGVLKNAIDWASRPPDQPFEDKPIAIIGASPGRLGRARAQYHLRQCFIFLNGLVINRPEVMIAGAPQMFDDQLRLTDEATREIFGKLLEALADWARCRSPGAGRQASRPAGCGEAAPPPSPARRHRDPADRLARQTGFVTIA